MSRNLTILTHGLARNRSIQRDAELRPLTGADEARLAAVRASQTRSEWASALISASTLRIGTVSPVSDDDARELSVGDRERLLLSLFALNFGRIRAVARCAAPACSAVMEVDLAVEQLLAAAPAAPERSRFEEQIDVAGERLRFKLRIANGGDLEDAARLSPEKGAELILRRCTLGIRNQSGRAVLLDDIISVVRQPICERLVAADPQSETVLGLVCPACMTPQKMILDAATFLAARHDGSENILVQVDRIARVYHWNEGEILALPSVRRRKYLALIAGDRRRS